MLAQNEGLAERFAQLGVPRTLDVGNLKADAPPPPVDLPGRRKLDAAFASRSVWLAASTHPGEDEIDRGGASAHAGGATRPAHHHRAAAPRARPADRRAVAAQGLNVALRSEGKLPEASTDIYVADTIGELGLFYALSPVAFVGGSLCRARRAEPGRADQARRRGADRPQWQNFRDAYTALLRAGGCKQVSDAASLAEAALSLLDDASARRAMTERASRAIAAMGGALPRTLAELERYLPPSTTLQHAS